MKQSPNVRWSPSHNDKIESSNANASLPGTNCTRGGFLCEGYAAKIPWSKPGVTKLPPPLQAREQMTLDPTAAYPRCPGCNQIHIPHCERASRSLDGRDGARVRNVVGDQERESPAPGNWSNGWNEPPHNSRPARAVCIPAPYFQPPVPAPGRALSPGRRNSQPQGPRQPHQHNPCICQHTPQRMGQTAYLTLPLVDSCHATPPVARQLPPAVHTTSAPLVPQPVHYTSQPRAHKTEKEKMLDGEPFLPSDELLMNERDHCSGALFRFNNIANPHVTISRRERDRNFRQIVLAQWVPSPRHIDRRPAVPTGGQLGENVNVATPFHCDYGYNLFIADDVTIKACSRLHDSAKIAIGRNTTIGNGVTIQTLKTPTDIRRLKGSNGAEVAREVHIGENVYIGDNAIIEAGVTISHDAIIRPGSIVSTVRLAQ
jgi:acetyltransferase-like isoleucine patch superfamily enzyme